jgi:ribose transport system substrate-binding protein
VVGVVQQAPDQEGYQAIKALGTLAGGGTIERVIKVPVEIVTKANVDKYRAAYR